MNFLQSQIIAFHLIARRNPALPPRRKAATAERHLQAIAKIVRYCKQGGVDSRGKVQRWAGLTLLEEGSSVSYPPGFEFQFECGDGVMKHVLREFAALIVTPEANRKNEANSKFTYCPYHVAFAAAYPSIWAVINGSQDPTGELMAAALAEMELIPNEPDTGLVAKETRY